MDAMNEGSAKIGTGAASRLGHAMLGMLLVLALALSVGISGAQAQGAGNPLLQDRAVDAKALPRTLEGERRGHDEAMPPFSADGPDAAAVALRVALVVVDGGVLAPRFSPVVTRPLDERTTAPRGPPHLI